MTRHASSTYRSVGWREFRGTWDADAHPGLPLVFDAVAFTPDGRRVISGHSIVTDGAVRQWDVSSGRQVAEFPFHDDKGLQVKALSAGGAYAAVCPLPIRDVPASPSISNPGV